MCFGLFASNSFERQTLSLALIRAVLVSLTFYGSVCKLLRSEYARADVLGVVQR